MIHPNGPAAIAWPVSAVSLFPCPSTGHRSGYESITNSTITTGVYGDPWESMTDGFLRFSGIEVVGARGFEPPTPRSRTECSTRLSHAPTASYCNPALELVRPRRVTQLIGSRHEVLLFVITVRYCNDECSWACYDGTPTIRTSECLARARFALRSPAENGPRWKRAPGNKRHGIAMSSAPKSCSSRRRACRMMSSPCALRPRADRHQMA